MEQGEGKGQMAFDLPGHCCSSISGPPLEIIYWLKSPYVIGSDSLVGHMWVPKRALWGRHTASFPEWEKDCGWTRPHPLLLSTTPPHPLPVHPHPSLGSKFAVAVLGCPCLEGSFLCGASARWLRPGCFVWCPLGPREIHASTEVVRLPWTVPCCPLSQPCHFPSNSLSLFR